MINHFGLSDDTPDARQLSRSEIKKERFKELMGNMTTHSIWKQYLAKSLIHLVVIAWESTNASLTSKKNPNQFSSILKIATTAACNTAAAAGRLPTSKFQKCAKTNDWDRLKGSNTLYVPITIDTKRINDAMPAVQDISKKLSLCWPTRTPCVLAYMRYSKKSYLTNKTNLKRNRSGRMDGRSGSLQRDRPIPKWNVP